MKNLNVVLVGSKYPRNVGLVSRILSNFGIQRLILIAQRCELNEEAKQGAAQGQQALELASTYSDWDDFFAKESDGLRIAFSRRQGKRRASLSLQETLKLEILDFKQPTFLIFGAEDHGLSAEDLAHVHRVTHFDLPGDLQSMNLSHSVLMALQGFYQRYLQISENSLIQLNNENSTYTDPEPFLRAWLEALQFDLESQSRWNALTMLKQLIMKATPTAEELHKLEMIIQQSIRKIQGSKSAD